MPPRLKKICGFSQHAQDSKRKRDEVSENLAKRELGMVNKKKGKIRYPK